MIKHAMPKPIAMIFQYLCKAVWVELVSCVIVSSRWPASLESFLAFMFDFLYCLFKALTRVFRSGKSLDGVFLVKDGPVPTSLSMP